MTIQIDIEDTDLIQREKKDKSGYYYQQIGFAHLPNSDGTPSRYPKEIKIMPSKDNSGNVVPYPVGKYTLSSTSFRANNYGQLELGFLSLRNLDPKQQAKSN